MKELLLKDFNKVISSQNKIILIDFYGNNCIPCNKLKPILEELEKKYSKSYQFYRINTDEQPQITKTYKILEVPTMMFFLGKSFIPLNSNKENNDRILGFHDKFYMDLVLSQIYGFCRGNNLLKLKKKRRRNTYWQRYHDKYSR